MTRLAAVIVRSRDRHFVRLLTYEEARVAVLRAYEWPEHLIAFAIPRGIGSYRDAVAA